MEGQILQQRSSYRRGLVLGLTMAEIMVLLVFCLLIAMAAFLKREETRRVIAEEQLKEARLQNERTREIVDSLSKSAAVAERVESLSGLSDPQAIDQYWRELVDSRTVVKEIEKTLSLKELREGLADVAALRASGINVDAALHDAEIVGAINRTITKPGEPKASMQTVLDTLSRGMAAEGPGGHQWPPIIRMSEADGYFFKSGSAELSPSFRETLIAKTPGEILNYIRKYDVDVIEVVGHTDERPIGARQYSNLDRDLLAVLKNDAGVVSLVPADNAGLGLARAVAVVSVLRQSPLLAGYKLIPLSGAQLVNTDETLAIAGSPGDIQQRRRIEIRLRKSNDTTGSVPSTAAAAAQH
jgi:flagellar motor protein MotB